MSAVLARPPPPRCGSGRGREGGPAGRAPQPSGRGHARPRPFRPLRERPPTDRGSPTAVRPLWPQGRHRPPPGSHTPPNVRRSALAIVLRRSVGRTMAADSLRGSVSPAVWGALRQLPALVPLPRNSLPGAMNFRGAPSRPAARGGPSALSRGNVPFPLPFGATPPVAQPRERHARPDIRVGRELPGTSTRGSRHRSAASRQTRVTAARMPVRSAAVKRVVASPAAGRRATGSWTR